MNTVRVIENRTNKVLEEVVVNTIAKMMIEGDSLRHKYNNKVAGGCTIEEYYTTPEYIKEDTTPTMKIKTWDCM